MYKRASAVSDAIVSGVYRRLHSPIFWGSDLIGSIAGIAGDKATDEDIEKWDDSLGSSVLPGVAAYRDAKRQVAAVKNDKPRTTVFTDRIGRATSVLASALVGGAIGKLSGVDNGFASGAAIGGGLGLGMTTIGEISGLMQKPLDDERRRLADERHSALMALFMPGYAGYQYGRRLRNTIKDEDSRVDQQR